MKCIELFYLNIDNFLPFIDKTCLNNFVEKKDFKSDKKKFQHAFGRFLTKFVAHKFGIQNPIIDIKNNKPYFTNSELFFSISHTNNIIAIALWSNNIGLDIEYMKERDFSKYFERYKISSKGNDKISFYKFWTQYEAEIKLQEKIESFHTFQLLENYMCTICTASELDIKNNLNIQELVLKNGPNNELINLQTIITQKNLSPIKLIHR